MCYQDFKDTFVCNTQLVWLLNLITLVVLSGFQRYFCMQYTTRISTFWKGRALCYQDFKDTFVCNTQRWHWPPIWMLCCVIRISKILLYAIHNREWLKNLHAWLCYQDFKDTFVCNTQLHAMPAANYAGCVIRISKILLYAIHNAVWFDRRGAVVVLSGFQRTIWLQKYKKNRKYANLYEYILLFLQQQIWRIYTIRIIPLCKHSGWYASIALFDVFNSKVVLL